MPKLEEIQKETKKALTDTYRSVKDFFSPPSKFEQVKRYISDLWNDEIKPSINQLDGTVKKGMLDFEKEFAEFQQNPDRTWEETAKFFEEEAKKLKNAVSNSPILKEFGKLLESAANLVKALITGKEITEPWKEFQKAATSLTSSIKEAVIGKDKGAMLR
jgi:hypothetical protein